MDTRTGKIRELKEGEEPAPHEVELTEEQADGYRDMSVAERLASVGSLVRGKLRARANLKVDPASTPNERSRALRAADHHVSRKRKIEKQSRLKNIVKRYRRKSKARKTGHSSGAKR